MTRFFCNSLLENDFQRPQWNPLGVTAVQEQKRALGGFQSASRQSCTFDTHNWGIFDFKFWSMKLSSMHAMEEGVMQHLSQGNPASAPEEFDLRRKSFAQKVPGLPEVLVQAVQSSAHADSATGQ